MLKRGGARALFTINHWVYRVTRTIIVLSFFWCFPAFSAPAPQTILFWHSMAGQLGDVLVQLTEQFNQRQDAYRIVPVYKGDYIESFTSFAAAFHAHQAPQLIQVFDVGTPIMQQPKGIIKPVDVLMAEQGGVLDKAQFYPGILEKYSDHGVLQAFPFNVSIPVMFYNADAFAKLHISSSNFPRDWDAFEQLLRRLHAAQFSCGYTTAYPAWILIDSFMALQGVSQIEGDKVSLNNKNLLAFIERVRAWQKAHYFEYGGRVDDATALFTSGKCLILSQSSGADAALRSLVPFRLGVAAMPRMHNTVRYNNVVGVAHCGWCRGSHLRRSVGSLRF